MQFHILNENYTPVAVMDNDLSDAINFNNSKFHRFLTGSADFFDFETSKLHVDHSQFQVGYWLAFKYDDRDRLQYINEISEAESDKMMTISSVSSNLDLNNETKQPFSATEAKPFKWYFDIIMSDTGYEIGLNEISNLTRKLSWDNSMTVRAFIQSVATQFDNVELDYEVVLNSDFTIKKRLVHIKKKIGEVRDDIELRYGDNVKTVKRTTSISELCTAVRPVSKDDNDKVIDISSLNDWQELDKKGNVKFFHKKGTNLIFAPQANARFGNRGHNVTGGGYIVHDFSYDKVSQNELFNRSHIYLKEHSVPAINYEVDGRTGAKIGDTLKIVDDGYTPQLILSARVLEQVVSFDNASVEQATFGNYKALQSQISADLIAKMQQLAEENAPYKAVTLTTNGLTFKNSEGSTTLTARLYKGSKEIMPESYEWTIDGVATSENSEQHEITADDINGKAVVRWSAVINGVTVAFDEVTITDVSDGTDGVSPTVTINPDTSLTIADAQGTSTTPALKGKDGIAGKDGKGIKSTAITYQASTNGTTAPTGTWSASVPTVAKGRFLWTRTIWAYTDNTTETGYAVAYIGTNGNTGTNGIAGKDGVGIKTTTITYADSTSGTTAPTSGWISAVPTVAAGSYLWTKTVWAYTDNTSETGYSVARMGLKGDKGDPGIKGSDGTSGIIVSSVAPETPQTGQLWQDSSTTPQIVKKWTGNVWVIWELYAQNLKADSLSALSANLGDVKAGTYTSWSIEDYDTYDYLSAVYMFKGGIRFFTIENPNTTDPDTSGVASGKLIRGMSVISGVMQFHQQSVPSGDTRTANDILKEVDGFWTRNPNSAVGGYCGSISSYKYPDGSKQLSIDTDNLQILAKATARGQRGYSGNVMLSSNARAVSIVPNTPYTIGSLANFDAIKLYGQLFARRNFTLELDLTGPQLQSPDFTGYTRMVSATTGSRNENADSREFMVYACINSALNTLLLKVFYRDGGGNWTENTSTTNTIYKVVPIIY